ncbi:Protein kinase domain-containing protein [Balamuthia mandrillaris]
MNRTELFVRRLALRMQRRKGMVLIVGALVLLGVAWFFMGSFRQVTTERGYLTRMGMKPNPSSLGKSKTDATHINDNERAVGDDEEELYIFPPNKNKPWQEFDWPWNDDMDDWNNNFNLDDSDAEEKWETFTVFGMGVVDAEAGETAEFHIIPPPFLLRRFEGRKQDLLAQVELWFNRREASDGARIAAEWVEVMDGFPGKEEENIPVEALPKDSKSGKLLLGEVHPDFLEHGGFTVRYKIHVVGHQRTLLPHQGALDLYVKVADHDVTPEGRPFHLTVFSGPTDPKATTFRLISSSSSASASTSSREGELLIEARDRYGNPKTAAGDTFYVRFSGPSIFAASRIKDNFDGTYSVFFPLTKGGTGIDAGLYQVSVKLQFRSFGAMTPIPKAALLEQAPFVNATALGEDWHPQCLDEHVKGSPHPLTLKSTGGTALRPPCKSGMAEGRWVERGEIWEPYACFWPTITANLLQRCLPGKKVLLLGHEEDLLDSLRYWKNTLRNYFLADVSTIVSDPQNAIPLENILRHKHISVDFAPFKEFSSFQGFGYNYLKDSWKETVNETAMLWLRRQYEDYFCGEAVLGGITSIQDRFEEAEIERKQMEQVKENESASRSSAAQQSRRSSFSGKSKRAPIESYKAIVFSPELADPYQHSTFITELAQLTIAALRKCYSGPILWRSPMALHPPRCWHPTKFLSTEKQHYKWELLRRAFNLDRSVLPAVILSSEGEEEDESEYYDLDEFYELESDEGDEEVERNDGEVGEQEDNEKATEKEGEEKEDEEPKHKPFNGPLEKDVYGVDVLGLTYSRPDLTTDGIRYGKKANEAMNNILFNMLCGYPEGLLLHVEPDEMEYVPLVAEYTEQEENDEKQAGAEPKEKWKTKTKKGITRFVAGTKKADKEKLKELTEKQQERAEEEKQRIHPLLQNLLPSDFDQTVSKNLNNIKSNNFNNNNKEVTPWLEDEAEEEKTTTSTPKAKKKKHDAPIKDPNAKEPPVRSTTQDLMTVGGTSKKRVTPSIQRKDPQAQQPEGTQRTQIEAKEKAQTTRTPAKTTTMTTKPTTSMYEGGGREGGGGRGFRLLQPIGDQRLPLPTGRRKGITPGTGG